MKLYKSLFRLDYPLSYSLVDRLGNHLEFLMDNSLNNKAFQNIGGELKLGGNHTCYHYGSVKEDNFRTVLNPTTFNSSIEHYEGLNLKELHNHKTIKLCGKLLEEKEVLGKESKYKRIGLRTWIIVENPLFTKDKILNYVCQSNKESSLLLGNTFSKIKDIMVTYELEGEQGTSARVSYGPYYNEEKEKYFTLKRKEDLNINISEALIFDIDIWDNMVKVPEFDLSSFCRFKIIEVETIVDKICKRLIKELS